MVKVLPPPPGGAVTSHQPLLLLLALPLHVLKRHVEGSMDLLPEEEEEK